MRTRFTAARRRSTGGPERAAAAEAFSKSREGKSKSRGRIFKAQGREIQIFRFRESRFIRGLGRQFVTGADSRANHYHSELIRRRRVGKRLFPLVLAIAALSIVRVRAREFASVTSIRQFKKRPPQN